MKNTQFFNNYTEYSTFKIHHENSVCHLGFLYIFSKLEIIF
jgi:hypothetical protein